MDQKGQELVGNGKDAAVLEVYVVGQGGTKDERRKQCNGTRSVPSYLHIFHSSKSAQTFCKILMEKIEERYCRTMKDAEGQGK